MFPPVYVLIMILKLPLSHLLGPGGVYGLFGVVDDGVMVLGVQVDLRFGVQVDLRLPSSKFVLWEITSIIITLLLILVCHATHASPAS